MTEPPEEPPQQLPTEFAINLPEQEEEGHYADFASIWHNDETFILDFAAMIRPPEFHDDGSGSPRVVVNSRIVTRVRIPAAQAWEVMRAMESQLTKWEKERQHATGGAQ